VPDPRPTLRYHFQPALLARHFGLKTTFGDGLSAALTAACLLPDTGARNIDSLLNQQILPVLSQQHHQYVHFFIKNRIVVGLMSSGTLRKNLLAIFDNLKGLNHARGQRRWAKADDAG